MEYNNPLEKTYELEIDTQAREHLKPITTWARIIALIGFINVGLSVLRFFMQGPNSGPGIFAGLFGTFISGAIMVVLYIFLLRFANSTAAGVNTENQDEFNYGISNLKLYFKTIGILLIIGISLVALMIVFGILGALMRG
jgi:uncharacterized membrane protein